MQLCRLQTAQGDPANTKGRHLTDMLMPHVICAVFCMLFVQVGSFVCHSYKFLAGGSQPF